MRTPNQEPYDDFLMDESDEYLLKMAEELKQELSDINVSEDLITRTLAKVSEQTKDDAHKADSNVVPINDIKAPVKYRRRYQWIKPLSVVAAACFILLLGANVAKNGLLSEKKESTSDSAAYEMAASDVTGDASAEVQDEKALKSAQPGAANTEESANIENDDYNVTFVAPQTTSEEVADTQNNEGKEVESFTGLTLNAYSRALESAINEAGDKATVYEFAQGSDDNKATSLLTLLTSEELSVTTEAALDEWQYYLVFSLGEDDAVTYQIGKSKFVIATRYHGEEEPSQATYQMKNTDTFMEALTGYLK